MRTVLLALFSLASAVSYAQTPIASPSRPAIPPTINLNSEGAMELLQRSDPQQYSRVAQFLEAAESLSCGGRELGAMQASMNVTALSCGFMLKTSYPPKRVVSFNLGQQRYTKLVTLRTVSATIPP